MTDLATFCRTLGLDEAAVRHALESDSSTAGRPVPWYVELLLGTGAWITAMIMIGFVILLLSLVFGFNDLNLGSAGIGAAMFLCGLILEARARASIFLVQFAIALVAAGTVIACASVGVEADSLWAAAVTAAVMAAITVWRERSAQQQFLLTGLAVGLAIAGLSDARIPYDIDIIEAAALVGLWLYLRPARLDLRPTATVLLLAMPLFDVVSDNDLGISDASGGWVARGIAIIMFLTLAWLHTRRVKRSVNRVGIAVVVAAAIAICLLLPPGGSAALAILMLAFTLGHWPLAIVGALLEVYFVPRFLYDLDTTLLAKSGILVAVGLVLLAVYVAMRRSGAEAS